MSQTKRKRRSKHRGNAAGRIEARGRTGRKPTAAEVRADARSGGSRSGARPARPMNPPTWKAAFGKAAFGAIMLFALMAFGVLGNKSSIGGSLLVCLFALVAYTPVMFVTDRFIYQRKMRKEAGG